MISQTSSFKKGKKCLLILFAFVTISQSFASPRPVLISPVGGISIPNNMPTLSWSVVVCDYYKVWVDNIQTDSVRSSMNASVPFPLSFGKHIWRVEAYTKTGILKSETGIFVVNDKPLSTLPEGALLLRNNWKVNSSFLVKDNGDVLSGSKIVTNGWYSTSVPATVLTALVRNGVYPNPYVGLNNMRIPDSNDEYNKTYDLLKYSHIPNHNPWKDPYWFRTEFEVPKSFKGKTVWLNFAEINYRAEVWLNGKKIADHKTMEGMEQLFRFDVTKQLKTGAKNHLAVEIYPVDVPGLPGIEPLTTLGEPGTNMGDGMISKSYTKWDAIGWDWQPAVRDRDMGITEDVFLTVTNPLEMNDIYVTSKLNLPDTTSANLQVSANMLNHSAQEMSGTVKSTISFGNETVSFDKTFKIEANSELILNWDSKSTDQMIMKNPKLWWPFGYGEQNLYTLKMEVFSNDICQSVQETKFGIREVETYVSAKERVYRINGKEIYPKGGNWVIDMMLNWTAKRYEDEILLTHNANLNILRVWGPTGVPPEVFYNAADKYGVLIWQDFLNDYWGTMANSPGYTAGDTVYQKATIAIVKKYRNHPSLIIWCGGNEGPNPREKLIMNEILPKYDGRSSRHYLKISNGDGVHGGGPYHTLSPEEYFTNRKLAGFSSEIGPSGVPEFESVMKFMPNIGRGVMSERFPLDGVWAYHDANDWPGKDSRKFSSYDNLVRNQYGAPTATVEAGVKEYLNKAQLLNYEVYRASIESINRQLWGNASGILLWKSNSSWPSMTWQVYDWYMQAHAGYYGCKSAAENVHIQLNRDKNDINLINTLHRNFYNLEIKATLLNFKLEKIWEKELKTSIAPLCNFNPGWLVPVTEEPCFLKLTVKSEDNNVVSENFYCLSSTNNYKALDQLPAAKLAGIVTKTMKDGRTTYQLKLTNNGNSLAYRIACKLTGKASGNELLPTLWSNNYVSLLPGESIILESNINNLDQTEQPEISCKAFNMKLPIIIEIK